MNPSSYPERTERVRKIETHASYVFLTDRFVYKIKKNVNFGFLDFSSLEKRKYFTEQELLLNKRLCEEIYIGILPLWMDSAGFSFQQKGTIAEYVLKMHRLSDENFFQELLKADKISNQDIDDIARMISGFFEKEKSRPEISEWGSAEKIKITTDENFNQTEEFVDFSISRESHNLIRFYTDQFYLNNKNLFQKRINNGWIKNCHGDMHLDHFHKHNNKWCIFDCIEFNERFRYTDAACDISFLLMDLDFNGRSDLALMLLDNMDRYLPDNDRKYLIAFYKCYRAFVRGKVESMIAKNVKDDANSIFLAKKYFNLSLKYALIGSTPLAVIFMGRIASGKSRLAKRLKEEIDVPIFSCDETRKTMAGLPLMDRTPEEKKKEIYSGTFSEKTYNTVIDSAISQLKSGQSALLDCTFSKRKFREAAVKKFKENNISFLFIEAVASEKIMKERLEKRVHKTDVISDARAEDFEKLNAGYELPVELSGSNYIQINTEEEKNITFYNLGKMLIEFKAKTIL